MDKIFGVGLLHALALFVFFVLLIVGAKVLVNKYNPPGLTEIVNNV